METNVIHATEDFLRSEINNKDEQINALTNQLNSYTATAMSRGNALRTMSEHLQHWTMTELENNGITEEQATELSEIGGFDLVKEVEAEVTVKYWITLQVPAGESAEDLINELDFESISNYSEAVTHISSEVEDISL